MITNPLCRKCGVELDSENWTPSSKKKKDYICKACNVANNNQWRKENPERVKARGIKWREENSERTKAQAAKWAKANPDKMRAMSTRARRKKGVRPFNENKACSSFLGVHVAERVLRHVFKDVEVMPYGNPGYDFICNRGKRVDVKSACLRKDGRWSFHIKRNTTADYFLCLAFDNREDLNPMHAWLIPGIVLSGFKCPSIGPSTLSRWDEYRLDLTKISDCCDGMR